MWSLRSCLVRAASGERGRRKGGGTVAWKQMSGSRGALPGFDTQMGAACQAFVWVDLAVRLVLVVSSLVLSRQVPSSRVWSCLVSVNWFLSCRVWSCLVWSRHVMSCHVWSGLVQLVRVVSCRVGSSRVWSSLVRSRQVAINCLTSGTTPASRRSVAAPPMMSPCHRPVSPMTA